MRRASGARSVKAQKRDKWWGKGWGGKVRKGIIRVQWDNRKLWMRKRGATKHVK